MCWGQSAQVAVTGYAPNPKISCQFRWNPDRRI